jgi:pimeloyl-ACP methyl ester carboxylesterase
MKKNLFVSLFFVVLLSCSDGGFHDNNSSPTDNSGNVPEEMNLAVKQASAKSVNMIKIISVKRQQLPDGIAHYTLLMQMGKNELDRIAVHRVIQEYAPWFPVRNAKGIMMVPGNPSNFQMAFLPSTASGSLPADQSIAEYLAKNNLDVWGIDMRYSLVPNDAVDFTIMKDWGLSVELNDIDFAIAFARVFRGMTGNGVDKMVLVGFSFGAFECYAMANAETQKPWFMRNISAILPIEIAYKFDPQYQDLKDAAYARYQDKTNQIESGVYANFDGAAIVQACGLSQMMPDEPSPIIPGFSNKQAFLFMVTCTYATVQPPLQPDVPFYHLLSGVFDENSMPVGLKYTGIDTVYEIASIMPYYDSLAKMRDYEAVLSDRVDVPYDDHLGDIKIPIFYIGCAGGYGKYGLYTLNLLGSSDKKSLIIQDYPDEYAALDYAHAEFMWSARAKNLIWAPMLDWIKTH